MNVLKHTIKLSTLSILNWIISTFPFRALKETEFEMWLFGMDTLIICCSQISLIVKIE